MAAMGGVLCLVTTASVPGSDRMVRAAAEPSEPHQAVATSEGFVLDTCRSAARGFSERIPRARRRGPGGCRGRAGCRDLRALQQALRGVHVHDQPIVLDLRELELMDGDSQSGRVCPRVMRL